jgi:hypothetical protein
LEYLCQFVFTMWQQLIELEAEAGGGEEEEDGGVCL